MELNVTIGVQASMYFLLLLLLSLMSQDAHAKWPPPPPEGPGSLKALSQELQVNYPPRELRIQIDKSDRKLTVFSGSTAVKEYSIALGGSPVGDKSREGDQRTPNGEFFVVTRNPRSSFHLFLALSYPTIEDATRGVTENQISRKQATAIRTAIRAGQRPPWDTPLGGAIGIHGGGIGQDWTLGCIALDNTAIEELWDVATKGTPVHIQE